RLISLLVVYMLFYMFDVFFFFFFSSRRRHTRCLSDWSSDVCSSDLYRARRQEWPHDAESLRWDTAAETAGPRDCSVRRPHAGTRSEERRVGKECRSGGGGCH